MSWVFRLEDYRRFRVVGNGRRRIVYTDRLHGSFTMTGLDCGDSVYDRFLQTKTATVAGCGGDVCRRPYGSWSLRARCCGEGSSDGRVHDRLRRGGRFGGALQRRDVLDCAGLRALWISATRSRRFPSWMERDSFTGRRLIFPRGRCLLWSSIREWEARARRW